MSLATGDLTTPQRVATWMAGAPALPSAVINQLITSMTALIYGKLNRSRLYSQCFTRHFSGVGTPQLVLPDWPVTCIRRVQVGPVVIPPSVIPPAGQVQPANTVLGYGYRGVLWDQKGLPGDPTVLDFAGNGFYPGLQNIQVEYEAGYLIRCETHLIVDNTDPSADPPITLPYVVADQPMGLWCRDNGVNYRDTCDRLCLIAVASNPVLGEYIPPSESNPGVYQFSMADVGQFIQLTYSFVPADLEEACIQMIAERYSYRGRIGEIMKSLGGQETVRFARGGLGAFSSRNNLPPEVADLINPYVSVLPPPMGAPL